MTTYFVSRHPGALTWAAGQHVRVDCVVAHLDPDTIQPGDTVIGTLPVNLAAQVCLAGARYVHLALDVPAHLRGCELSAHQLSQLGARLQAFDVRPLPNLPTPSTQLTPPHP